MMTDTELDIIKSRVTNKLSGLNQHLSYHNLQHTLDVMKQSLRIAREEGITNEKDLQLLTIASLYHDTGFMHTYTGHEEESCRIFLDDSNQYMLGESDKNIIVGMIMSTKLPQSPQTILEKIICDADLDYLGRKDFFALGNELRNEFLYFGIVASEEAWKKRQLEFLLNHHYFTNSSLKKREAVKQEHIALLS